MRDISNWLCGWMTKVLEAMNKLFSQIYLTNSNLCFFATENYRLQSKYENHLIVKVTIFQFVNSFLSLFYIAFYLRDQDKLKEQLAGLLISRQIIGNLRESAFPYFMEQLKLAKLSFNLWGALSPTQESAKTIPSDSQTQVNINGLLTFQNRQAYVHKICYFYYWSFFCCYFWNLVLQIF